MPLRALAACLVAFVLFAARPAAACDSCSVPGGTLATPVGSCQTVSGSTDSSCRTDVYAVDLVAGEAYVFTLCSWGTCTAASASFNARLRVRDTSCGVVADVDDWCATEPEITFYPTVTGRHFVEITGSASSDFGSYTLAYYKSCWDDACWTPAGDLGAITTSCQILTDTITCTSKTYSVTLVQGQRYTLTLCGATCPGADAVFDSALELYDPSGIVVASSSSGCGDDGEIVYQTDSMTGGGTYCVRVVGEGSAGRFALGYRVACQAPSALSLSPLVARTTLPGCAETENFTITTGGTATFDATWSITPPLGGSAAPASGAFPMSSNTGRFTTTLTGVGTYRVSVSVRNSCGTATQVFDYDLRDRTAPDLTLTAAPGCNPPPAPAPEPAPEPAPTRAKSLHSGTLPAQRVPTPEMLAAGELKTNALAAREGRLLPPTFPGLHRPPEAQALGCATPCDYGVLEADGLQYDVFLQCEDGSFSARTGANHPVTIASGFPQNVIYGGASASPGTSDIAFMFHDVGLMYQDPTGGRACVFDPPDTPGEPNSVGIELEWDVVPDAGLAVTLREEIVAFGTDETNSGVRLTLGATNSAGSTRAASMGVRWQIDYQNGGDDGPLFATVACNPPAIVDTLDMEHELDPTEIQDFYRIQNNTGDPIFSNFTNTTEISGFPDTGTPDRLVYGYWPDMVSGDWDRIVNEGDLGVDYDSAVHYWFGHDAATAISVAPGESFTRSVVIFSSGENVDCGGFTPGNAANADLIVCEGDCAELGALAADACGAAFVDVVGSTPGAPPCVGNPCDVTFPAAGTWQYTWEARDAAGNATQAITTVQVRPASDCLTGGCLPTGAAPPPVVRTCEGVGVTLDASSMGLTGCTGTVRTEWREGAVVVGTSPTLNVSPTTTTVYTVTVSCSADASCFTSAAITVRVDRMPIPGAVTVADLAQCNLGVLVSWAPAQFFNGGGVYNVYRSETSCADALTRPPVLLGLARTETSWIDAGTTAGATYFYVVQAEDDPTGTPCRPLGPHHGGPAAFACAGPVTDVSDDAIRPAEVWAPLRVTHSRQQITLDWTGARSLLAGEHFHVLKALGTPTIPFEHANSESDTSRSWTNVDTSSWIQFFDVRVADACENVSRKEYPVYPNGYDLPR